MSGSAGNLLFNSISELTVILVERKEKTWTRLLHAQNHSLFQLKSVRGSFVFVFRHNPLNTEFSMLWEGQKQADKGNFRLTSVVHERRCLSSIFSIVPVYLRIQMLRLFCLIQRHYTCLMCLSKRMPFFHSNDSFSLG